MTELKPCPFCGGEAYTRFVADKNPFGYASAECRACGAVPYVHQVYSGTKKEDAVQGVIKAWNRRASDEQID